jgi:hypothetical protein
MRAKNDVKTTLLSWVIQKAKDDPVKIHLTEPPDQKARKLRRSS